IADETIALALTIADNGYMGLDSASLIDLPMGWQQTRSYMRLFPMGKTGLPASSRTGDVAVKRPGYSIRFENKEGARRLTAHIDNFCDGKPLDADITLSAPPEDSLVIATPFAGKPRHFYYNQKINCLCAQGYVTLGGDSHAFEPDRTGAVLDWGRGVWTYRNTWYWSSASGRLGGIPFGFNLGYGFGDTSAATENMLFYAGKAHKLEHVTFHIPKTPTGKEDWLSPWTFEDRQGRLRLTFTPMLDRAALTNLWVLKSDQHQVFGAFDGSVTLDDGTVLEISHLIGFAEKVSNRW
ncbi:MAG TPA: DUF2804 domain-containing protein, partial [Candidatus Limiplasma sp.]|nr:DUF2804 domain-containing protein [Candidatus Limiplasma sp.]